MAQWCKGWLIGLFSACFVVPCLAAEPAQFDAKIAMLEHGDIVLSETPTALKFLDQLATYIDANDRPRQIRLARESCFWRYLTKPADGIAFADHYIQDSSLSQDYTSLSYFYLCRAYHHVTLGDSNAESQDLLQSQRLAEKSENALAIADVALSVGEAKSASGEHAEALVSLYRAYQFYQRVGNRDSTGYALESIATAYRRMGEYAKALEYLEQSEKDYVSPTDKARLVTILQQKAFVFAEQGRTPEARLLFNQVRSIFAELGEKSYVVSSDIDLMWVANLEGKYADTIEIAESVKTRLQSLAASGEGVAINQLLFPLYEGEARVALGQLEVATRLFQQTDAALKENPNKRYQTWLLRVWSQAEAKAGNYNQAYSKLVQANQLQDELNSQAKLQREALLRFQFDSDLKENQHSQLQAEQRLTELQVQELETAQRWQYIAIALFVVLSIIALFYAISQILRNKRLQRLALTDELTQVANRRSILAYAEQTRSKANQLQQPWSLCIADIDHFKLCNDTFGHEAGDEVLTAVAACLKQYLRSQDRLGRSGGEEFLLVLPDTSQQNAVEIANRLRQHIETLQFSAYPQIKLTISIGVTQAGRHEEIRETMARADKALYEAKDAGRNQVIAH